MSTQEPYRLAVDLAEQYDIPLEKLLGDSLREVRDNLAFNTGKDID